MLEIEIVKFQNFILVNKAYIIKRVQAKILILPINSLRVTL